MPNLKMSFEAGDIVSQVMSFGSPTPVQIDVQGVDLRETGPGKQLKAGFERAQGAQGSQGQWRGQRPGDQQRDDMRVGQGDGAESAGDRA